MSDDVVLLATGDVEIWQKRLAELQAIIDGAQAESWNLKRKIKAAEFLIRSMASRELHRGDAA